jgi:hypothetical protein
MTSVEVPREAIVAASGLVLALAVLAGVLGWVWVEVMG